MNSFNLFNSFSPPQTENKEQTKRAVPPELCPFRALIRAAWCNELPCRTLHIPMGRATFTAPNPNTLVRRSVSAVLQGEEPPDPARLRGLTDILRRIQQALDAPQHKPEEAPARNNVARRVLAQKAMQKTHRPTA